MSMPLAITMLLNIFMFMNENMSSYEVNNKINAHIDVCKIDVNKYNEMRNCISKLWDDQLILLVFKLSMREQNITYSQSFRDIYNFMIIYKYT